MVIFSSTFCIVVENTDGWITYEGRGHIIRNPVTSNDDGKYFQSSLFIQPLLIRSRLSAIQIGSYLCVRAIYIM